MQEGMNFTSYVGDFKDVRNYFNSDPSRYLNSVSTEAQIETEGDFFIIYLLKVVHFQPPLAIWI